MDLQKYSKSGRGASLSGPSCQPSYCGSTASGDGLQSAGQSQDPREGVPSGSQCPVRVHLSPGSVLPGSRTTGHLDRHEKEGIDRQLQEFRRRMATQASARKGPLQGLQEQATWEGRSLWLL